MFCVAYLNSLLLGFASFIFHVDLKFLLFPTESDWLYLVRKHVLQCWWLAWGPNFSSKSTFKSEQTAVQSKLFNTSAHFYHPKDYYHVHRCCSWSLCWASLIQCTPSQLGSFETIRLCWKLSFRNLYFLNSERLLSSSGQSPVRKATPLSTIHVCIWNIFAATLDLWRAPHDALTWIGRDGGCYYALIVTVTDGGCYCALTVTMTVDVTVRW